MIIYIFYERKDKLFFFFQVLFKKKFSFMDFFQKKAPIENNQKKIDLFSLSLNAPSDYTDPSKKTELKIKEEKRRRYQAYMMLDYFLCVVSYFDFFDFDSFFISTQAKYYGQFWKKKVIPSEFLFFSFFQFDPSFSELLQKYQINEEDTGNLVILANPLPIPNFFLQSFSFLFEGINKLKFYTNSLFPSFFSKDFSLDSSILYSRELNSLFEKASENALERFKTPLISSDILFLTLIEEKNKRSRLGKIIDELIPSDDNWYLLRYQLIKRLHQKETALRNEVDQNQKYFGYLFHTQLSNTQFSVLLKNKYLNSRVAIFRKMLIIDVLKKDYFEHIIEDTNKSIRVTNTRSYTF
jgi:hypothetical protein